MCVWVVCFVAIVVRVLNDWEISATFGIGGGGVVSHRCMGYFVGLVGCVVGFLVVSGPVCGYLFLCVGHSI